MGGSDLRIAAAFFLMQFSNTFIKKKGTALKQSLPIIKNLRKE